jgi:hypothetical protein
VKEIAEFLARHPVLVPLLFGVLAGVGAYRTFNAGQTYAVLRSEVGDRAREASEALGG